MFAHVEVADGKPAPDAPDQRVVTIEVTFYSAKKFTQSLPARAGDLMRWKCVRRSGPVPEFTVLGNPRLPVFADHVFDGRDVIIGQNGVTKLYQVRPEDGEFHFEVVVGEQNAEFFRPEDAFIYDHVAVFA